MLNAAGLGNLIDDRIQDLKALGPIWKPDLAILYQMSKGITELSNHFMGGGEARADVQTVNDSTGINVSATEVISQLVEGTTSFQ